MDLALDRHDDTALVARDDDVVSRAGLRARSDALVNALKESAARSAIVRSDDPVDILRAIDACARSGVDLYIAHTTIPDGQIADIVAAHRIQFSIGSIDAPIAGAAGKARPVEPRFHIMTSGTAGTPKIAAHTLAALLGRARAAGHHPANSLAKWLLTYQPSGFAGIQVILTAVSAGGLIVAPMQRTPRGFYDAAMRWNVAQVSGTPTFWRAFLMAGDPAALRLRQVTMGGEAADQALLDRLKAAFPDARVTHTYASTEAGVVFAVHDGREGFPAAFLEQPINGVELRIRDGFLQVRTPHRMQGYVSQTAQPITDDGWLATADRCELVGDRVLVLGRGDKTINVGGYKVYPLAIERVLLAIPGILEARVYGVASPISGALVAADVVLSPDEVPEAARKRILAACRAQLASYQVPRVLKFVAGIDPQASGKKG